jgi:hypothetical protein
MIIAIDFDGVIARAEEWPKIGEMLPGACDAIHSMRKAGNFVIVNTCRSNGELIAVVDWMREKGIQYDLINDNHPDMVKKYANNSRKINADVYIDDRNLGGFPGWKSFEVISIYDLKLEKCTPVFLLNTALKVSEHFGVTIEQLQSPTQVKEVVEVRYLLFWYGLTVLKLRDKLVGSVFNRNRATVIWGCKQVINWEKTDHDFREKFNKFKNLIHESKAEV